MPYFPARLRYWRRIIDAYLLGGTSQLSFWHERPEAHPAVVFDRLGPYYMTFAGKARYAGPFDAEGVPQLDYRGNIGRQYNPIAVAQYGLARYNCFLGTGSPADRTSFLAQADWLVRSLEPNASGIPVWMHHFDFEYRSLLKAPWYSGLAQGQGLSLLARAHQATGERRYAEAMRAAFASLTLEVDAGGVLFRDGEGSVWIEEYLVDPPTHILNGFIWALWGVWDYALATGEGRARSLFEEGVKTIARNRARYDTGWWSLYELSGTRLPMLASPFYHRLHIVQLRILAALTGQGQFAETARRWEGYAGRRYNRMRSFVLKCVFKFFLY